MIRASGDRIEREVELIFPAELEPRLRQLSERRCPTHPQFAMPYVATDYDSHTLQRLRHVYKCLACEYREFKLW